jgi:hypothetical protein
VQEDWLLGTAPLLVEGLNVQEIVNTVVPAGCWTVIVADVKATSVIVSVQCGLGQPGAPGIGFVGALVVTLNETFPFLISEAGIACEPVSVTGAGF